MATALVNDSSQQLTVAQLHVEERLKHYKKLIAENKNPGEYYLEESVTLKDGGQLQHLQTPHGSAYHLVKGERWMFVEKTPATKALYVCELDEHGLKKLSHNTTFLK